MFFYLLFGHDYVDIFHFIYHSTLRRRTYKKFSQTQPVDKVYWLCLNLLYIVDYFKSTTRVNCKEKNCLAGVAILTSFESLPAGGKCYKRTVATLHSATARSHCFLFAT